jgi:tetratricopeptide (TPR) repeat protein/predicted Ser/Thr protein kinase
VSDPLSERAMQRLLAMAAEHEAEPAAPPLPERYEVVGELGRGGMGIVYECHDHTLDRRCAVKTIGAGAGADAATRRRFAREAQSAARLRHPHIAEVYDATEDYLSMRVVRGAPIDRDPGPPRAIAARIRDAARALQHAHEQGVVHRDVKPSNLLVENGHVFVVDFGLAKAVDHDASLSMSGAVVGTPAFMSTEQALGRGDVGAATDVYGLGATLFACLTGAPPFAADDLPSLLRKVLESEPPRSGVDRDLDTIVGHCLHKEPERRYRSAGELADDLDRWLADEPIQARPPSFGYRLRKRLRRQRTLWRAAGIAALLTALVLVPIAMQQSAARAAASEAVALADHAAALARDAEQLYRIGDADTAREKLDAGIELVEDFVSRNDVPRAHYLHSRLLRLRGRPEDAIAAASRALSGDPSLTDARFERGLLLAALPQPGDAQLRTAIEDLRVGVGDRSALTSVDRLFGRAELLRLQGQHERAMELLRGVLEQDQFHVEARVSMARLAVAIGDDQLAQYYSSTAFDLQRGYGMFYSAEERSSLPTTMLGLRGALVDFSKELPADAGNERAKAFRALVNLRRSIRLLDDGQPERALEAVDAALDDHEALFQVVRGVAGAHNNRGVCSLHKARLLVAAGRGSEAATARREAAADFEQALALQPALAEAHCNRGVAARQLAQAFEALGRRGAADAQLQRAEAALTQAEQLAAHRPWWPHARVCREELARVRAISSSR